MTSSLNETPVMIPPSPWVERHLGCIRPGSRVLDLACGQGRHTRLTASLGYPVLAVDRDLAAISSLGNMAGVTTAHLDLEGEDWPLAGELFAGIIVTNYLWRPRLPELVALLAPGGILIYETFMVGNAAYGKPSNPEFLLRSGELRQLAADSGLREIAFAEGYSAYPKPAMIQAICAVRD